MNGRKILGILTLTALVIGLCFTITDSGESTEGASGSQSNPLSSYSASAGQFFNADSPIYVSVGGTVSITAGEYGGVPYIVTNVTSSYNLTVSSNNLTGTISKAGTITVTIRGVGIGDVTGTIYAVQPSTSYTYTLSFNANGGSGAPSYQSETSTASTYTFTIPNTTPTRTGYTFVGWGVSSGTTTVYKHAGETVTLVSSDPNLTLFALWRTFVYNLYYDANGGSGAPSYQTSGNQAIGGTYTFTVSNTQPTYSGKTFLGWSESSSAGSPSYVGGDSFSLTSAVSSDYVGTVTTTGRLYAVWQSPTTYSYQLSYNANGGSGAPSTQTATNQTVSSYSFQIVGANPTHSSKIFLGWSESPSATYPTYTRYDYVTLTGSANTTVYKTLYAVWSERYKYSLTLNYNGGTYAGDSSGTWYYPSNQTTWTTDSTHTFTIPSVIPTKSGYYFMGWDTSSSATTVVYNNGDTTTISGSPNSTMNRTLYAVYGVSTTYTLSYDANGGTGAPASQTYTTANLSWQFTVSSTAPTRTNYTFLGWADSSSASVPDYVALDVITLQSSAPTKTIYAVWEGNYLYTITYNANGGSGAPASQTYGKTGDTSHQFTIPNTTPTRTNYEFVGWGLTSGTTTVSAHAGDTVTLYSSGQTREYFALWRAWEHTLIYDANGGTGAPASQTSGLTTNYQASFVISNTIPVLSDRTFLGWGESPSDGVATYVGGDTITWTTVVSQDYVGIVSSTTTIYAIWQVPDLYNYVLVYDANGGTGAPANKTATNQTTNTYTFDIFGTASHSTKMFMGWADSPSATVPDYASFGDTVTLTGVANDTVTKTIYAVWSERYKYELTLDYMGGTYQGQGSETWKYPYPLEWTDESSYTRQIPQVVPTKDGYGFIGWDTSSAGTTVVYEFGDSITIAGVSNALASVTLYAVYDTAYTYRLIYDALGGTGAPETQTYGQTFQTSHQFTISATEPTLPQYVFLGWSRTAQSETAEFVGGDNIILYSTNPTVTLYAVWQGAYNYTLSYNANGGSGAPASQTSGATASEDWTFIVTSAEPTRGDHAFMGWSTSSVAVTPTIFAGDEYTLTSSQQTVTLYAVWVYAPMTYWSNDEYNGTVSILFHMEDARHTGYNITASIPLYKFMGQDSNPRFQDSDYRVTFSLYNTVGDDFRTYINAKLTDDSDNIVTSNNVNIGKWSNVIITISPYDREITYTTVLNFKTFQDYERKSTDSILSWTNTLTYDNMAIHEMEFNTTSVAPRQEVIDTLVFLNTYGVVMTDPTFDIDDYWTSQLNIRFAIMSFALYGTSVTFNGITFPVSDAKVTVPYDNTSNGAVYNADGKKSRTLTLTNIYLTWQDNHCYLTFNDVNWQVDLGAYHDRTISMSGLWYFNSGVFESYTESQTYYTKDWWHTEFDFTTFALILLGLLVFAGIVVRLKTKAKFGDLMIIAGAGLIAFILIGGLTI